MESAEEIEIDGHKVLYYQELGMHFYSLPGTETFAYAMTKEEALETFRLKLQEVFNRQ